ncbi:MAG: preprotein translocase subunit SecE [Elusimicrobia bacterium]|nr:preprotein translocase subunit SecE [Elusimicrobiota bacterium]
MEKIIKLPKTLVEFFKEAYAELKKVTWLSRQDAIKATYGVFIVVIFFAIYVGILDFVISKIMALIMGTR